MKSLRKCRVCGVTANSTNDLCKFVKNNGSKYGYAQICLECKAKEYHLTKGNTKPYEKHGSTNTRLYKIWSKIKQRCLNKNNDHYEYYGGKGISICNEWNKYSVFKDWALNNGYSNTLTIDRINPNGNYEPSNCRWVDRIAQAQNTRLIRLGNSSGYRGVSFHKKDKRWRARISVNGKNIHIGNFKTKEDAAKAYNDFIDQNMLMHPKNVI